MSIRKNESGYTIVELLVVIGMMAILMSIGVMNFSNMQRKSKIEQQAREMLADFNRARSDSIFKKQRHSISMNGTATGYVLKRYSSENESRTAGGTEVQTKSCAFQFAKESGDSAADLIFQFDILGFNATDDDIGTLRINPVGSGAAFDCIVISASRTNIGRMEGSSCVQK